MYLKTKTMFTYKIYSCHAVTAVLKLSVHLEHEKEFFCVLVGGKEVESSSQITADAGDIYFQLNF